MTADPARDVVAANVLPGGACLFKTLGACPVMAGFPVSSLWFLARQ